MRNLEYFYTKWFMRAVTSDLEQKTSLKTQRLSKGSEAVMCSSTRVEVARSRSTEAFWPRHDVGPNKIFTCLELAANS